MTTYLLCYYAFFVFLIFNIKIEKFIQNKRLWFVFVTLMYAIIIANKPQETADFQSYVMWFERCKEVLKIDGIRFLGGRYLGSEPAFLLLLSLIKKLYPSYRFAFFVISFVITLCSVIILKKIEKLITNRENSFYSVTLCAYVAYFGFAYAGIALRAGVASIFGLLSCYYAMKSLKKNYVFVVATYLLAILFHRTAIFYLIAIVGLVIPPLKKTTLITVQTVILIFMITGIVKFFRGGMTIAMVVLDKIGILGGTLNSYMSDVTYAIGIKNYYFVFLLLFLFTLIDEREERKRFRVLYTVLLFAGVLNGFFSGIRALKRLCDMLMLFVVPIVSAKYYGIEKKTESGRAWCVSKQQMAMLIYICLSTVSELLLSFKILS